CDLHTATRVSLHGLRAHRHELPPAVDGAPEHPLTAARVPRSETLVAVCPRSFSAHPGLRALLQERYANVRFNDSGQRLIGDALVHFLDGAEKGIVGIETIDGPLLDRVPHLR